MNNHEKYDIKLASEVNIDALSTFYKLAYPDRHKLIFKYMKWYYRTSLFNLEPLVIEIDNEIVGHAGMMSSYLSYNNNKWLFGGGKEEFKKTIYTVLLCYKMLVIVFNIVPYVALIIIN